MRQTFETTNGWTKAEMLAWVMFNYNGKSVRVYRSLHSCRYRGPNGKKCAVGMFIPDELYNPLFEGAGACELLQDNPELCSNMPLEPMGMRVLQGIHDDSPTNGDEVLQNMVGWIKKNVRD